MTNQQWSPAALAHELFTAAQLAPGEGIENAVGRLAALVEAQQPAPSAAADLIAALEEARSAINSMKVEAETAGQGDEQMMLEACETISNEGLQADIAIRAALASAPQPSPTPQADSQPAEVWDYPPLPDFDTVEQHIYGACRRYITQDMLEPIHNLIRDAIDTDRAAQPGYDAARLEIESLQARVQELGAMLRENRSKRIVELEAQLEAIGAGGVEPLRRRECLHQIEEPAPAGEYPPLPTPDSYLFQHEETGVTHYVDSQQVEWGFEKNNPRLQRIGGAFTADQMRAYVDADRAARAPADSVLEDAEIDRIVPALEPVSEDFPAEWAVWKDRERIREELRAARKQGANHD